MPYYDQLHAIRKILDDPNDGNLEQGYDLLFKLWLSNSDRSDFIQELIQDAVSRPSLINEFRKRLGELRLRSAITDTYLRERFEAFVADVESHRLKKSEILASQVSNLKPDATKNNEQFKVVQLETIAPGKKKTKIKWSKQRITAMALFGFFFVFGVVINMKYINPKNPPKTRFIPPNLILTYTSPKYISEEDENSVTITLVNKDENQPFSGRITLVFSNGAPIMPVPGRSLSMEVANLEGGDRKTEQLTFTLPKSSSQKAVDYYLRILPADGSALYQTADDKFLVSPFPRMWTVLASLMSAGGLGGLLVTFLNEKLLNVFKFLFQQGDKQT